MQLPRLTRVPLALVALLVVTSGCGPLGPIPGGALRGPVHEGPLPAWSTVADVEQIQLETRPDDPHSVNTWCGVHAGSLYVPTSLIRGADDPMEREWVRNVIDDPRVRARIDGVVYPLLAVRVEDDPELAAARAMLLEKYDVEPDDHVARGWIFRLDPR
jgi:hypothetical protein